MVSTIPGLGTVRNGRILTANYGSLFIIHRQAAQLGAISFTVYASYFHFSARAIFRMIHPHECYTTFLIGGPSRGANLTYIFTIN